MGNSSRILQLSSELKQKRFVPVSTVSSHDPADAFKQAEAALPQLKRVRESQHVKYELKMTPIMAVYKDDSRLKDKFTTVSLNDIWSVNYGSWV